MEVSLPLPIPSQCHPPLPPSSQWKDMIISCSFGEFWYTIIFFWGGMGSRKLFINSMMPYELRTTLCWNDIIILEKSYFRCWDVTNCENIQQHLERYRKQMTCCYNSEDNVQVIQSSPVNDFFIFIRSGIKYKRVYLSLFCFLSSRVVFYFVKLYLTHR